MSWDHLTEQIREVKVVANQENELVTVNRVPKHLECIGIGTDAAVLRSIDEPNFAFKVFSSDKIFKMEMEKQVYESLGHSKYFPEFYGNGPNFLTLSFEEGITLYDCLLKGIRIPNQAILDVEEARVYARSKGLNPKDIHLRNILLHEGKAKLIDVSEYLKQGNDARWDHLKQGYHEYYPLIDGVAVPYWMIETVRKWYNQSHPGHFHFQDFVHIMIRLFRIHSKVLK